MLLSDRIRAVLDHCGVGRAHFAGAAMGLSLPELCTGDQDLAASLTLVQPQTLSIQVLDDMRVPLAIIMGDHGAGVERMAPILEERKPNLRITLDHYNAVSWSDVARDRGDQLLDGLCGFLSSVDNRAQLRAVRPTATNGSVAGVNFRAVGEGPPLVLFPLGVPSIYSIGPSNGDSVFRHDIIYILILINLILNSTAGQQHRAHSAGSCRRTLSKDMQMLATFMSPQSDVD